MNMEDEGFTYTLKDEQLLRVPNKIDADAGLWPFSNNVSVSFGDHPKADPLNALRIS